MRAGIAGGGIMGQLLAFALLNRGWKVSLFDSGQNNCSLAAAGLLTPISELEKNDLVIFQLGIEAFYEHWPIILNILQKNIYFRQSGSLILSHPRDQPALTNFIHIISHKLGTKNFYQKLKEDEIAQFEVEATKFNCGYYFPSEGQIDSQMLLSAMKKHLIEKGISWFKHNYVTSIKPGQIILADKRYQFDLVFDCRGLGAIDQFNDLRSVRGELIWLAVPNVKITRPIRFLHPRYSLYIVPRPKQLYLVGASEIESNDTSNISVRTMLELLTAVYYINSKFSEARVVKTVTGCRPTLSNHLPKIRYADGLVAVNGLYRHGFLIAPTLAHDIVEWAAHRKIIRHEQLWEKY